MSNIGVTLSDTEIVNPDNLTGESYRAYTADAVNALKRNIVPNHWAFANVMAEIIPFTMETVSPTSAHLALNIPKLNANTDINRPKQQLSGGLSLHIRRGLIVGDRYVHVPMISFVKYSLTTSSHKFNEVKMSEILGELKIWTEAHRSHHQNPFDFSDIVELALLTFLGKGFKIYSGVAFLIEDRHFFRIAFLRDDMFTEMIVTMDDLFRYGEASNLERKTVLC